MYSRIGCLIAANQSLARNHERGLRQSPQRLYQLQLSKAYKQLLTSYAIAIILAVVVTTVAAYTSAVFCSSDRYDTGRMSCGEHHGGCLTCGRRWHACNFHHTELRLSYVIAQTHCFSSSDRHDSGCMSCGEHHGGCFSRGRHFAWDKLSSYAIQRKPLLGSSILFLLCRR